MLGEIFNQILNMSITGGYIIIAVIIARLIIRKAPKKFPYLLWSAVAFRLAVPISFQSFFSLLSIIPFNKTTLKSEENGTLNYLPAVTDAASYYNTEALTERAIQNTAGNTEISVINRFADIFPNIWLSIMIAIILYGAVSYIILKIKMQNAILKEKNIYESDRASSPFILGIISPKIYIPFGLNEKTYSCIIAHERCHLKRYDHYIKMFAFILLAVHWFNPLCWAAFILMTADMEMSCDEKVLAENNEIRKEYSNALLSFAASRNFLNTTPLCFSENNVKKRIKNVLKFKKPKLIISILTVLLCLAIIISCSANPNKKTEESISENESSITANDINTDINTQIENAFKSFDSPGTSSNPGDYIDKNSKEYQFLINNKDYTIRYIYSKFLNGGQYDIYGHFYRIIMDDITGEVLKLACGTGQEYFDEFLKYNQYLLARNDAGFMKANYPYGYMLLEMINSSSNTDKIRIIDNQIKSITENDIGRYSSYYEMICTEITGTRYIGDYGSGIHIYKFTYEESISFYIILDDNNSYRPVGITYYLNNMEYAYQNYLNPHKELEITTQLTDNKSEKSENVSILSQQKILKIAEEELNKEKYIEYVYKLDKKNTISSLLYRPILKEADFVFDEAAEYVYSIGLTINSDDDDYNSCQIYVNAENGRIISVDFFNTYDMI